MVGEESVLLGVVGDVGLEIGLAGADPDFTNEGRLV